MVGVGGVMGGTRYGGVATGVLCAAVVLLGAWGFWQRQQLGESRRALEHARQRSDQLRLELEKRVDPPKRPQPPLPAPAPVTPVAVPPVETGDPELDDPFVTFDLDSIRNRLISGDFPVDLVTPESIAATLEAHGRTPGLLIAASWLTTDPEARLALLKEALEVDPTHPGALAAYLGVVARDGVFSDEDLTRLETLEKVDPSNALADIYQAAYQFQQGDTAAGLAAMSEASAKSQLSDYGLSRLPDMEQFYLDVGCSESVAQALSAFQVPIDYMVPLQSVNGEIEEAVAEALGRGETDRAIDLIRDGTQLSRTLSSSGRYLISDLIGISLENDLLEQELEIHRSSGNAERVAHVERRIAENNARRSRARQLGSLITDAAASFEEEDLLEYIRLVITVGEDHAALERPEFRERLFPND
jgi:hypothetical protein